MEAGFELPSSRHGETPGANMQTSEYCQEIDRPSKRNGLDIILIHGMGRTPLSMGVLFYRLHKAGFKPSLFGYSPTFESFSACTARLVKHIGKTTGNRRYALVGHSLGTVLIRGSLPALEARPPLACFFLAPPSRACLAARFFAGNPLYKLLMGEMGQQLANENFMAALPKPLPNTWIYAGTKGLRGRFSPFGGEANDGILTVTETQAGPETPVMLIPAMHAFIMNSPQVADGIINTLARLQDAKTY